MIQALTMLPEITACEVATDVECSNPSFMTNFLETDEEKEEEYDEASSFAKDEIGLNIQETFASTMTAPFWSRDNQQQQQQQHQSNDHQIFIKNICLVDTPGYGACIDVSDMTTPPSPTHSLTPTTTLQRHNQSLRRWHLILNDNFKRRATC